MKQSFFEETGCDILGLFINRVHNTPDDVVIFSNDISITYKEAWRMVNHYAAEIEKKTCNKHTRVLLYLNHSYKIIISILAVLKTGNSYVPVSKSNGTERLFQISRYCNSDIVITDEKLVTEKKLIQFDDLVHYVDTDDFTYHRYSSGEEVYVLFTSGSTGEPKGCSLVYSNLVYILRNMITIGSCQSDSVYCFSTPYTFDVSTTEIFGFVYGASIYVCDISGYTSFRRFPADIQKYHITHIALSPSGLRNMLQAYSQEQWAQINSTVECIMVAGEVFDKEIFSQWDEAKWRFRLLNLYGPTEATVYATQYELHHGEVFEGSIPIGQPLQGCGYLIDKCGRDGVGELVLYGDGIANGYINNVTEEKKDFLFRMG